MLIDLDIDQALDAAVAHHQAGRIDLAKTAYRTILGHAPDQPDALNLLGLILQDQGELAQATALIARALEIEPDFPEALSNLARANRLAGDPAAAVQAARRAIDLDPALPEAYLQLGHALIDLGDPEAAAPALQQATTLAPHTPDALRQLGLARLRLKDYPEAARVLRAALDLDNTHADTMVHLGTAMAGLDRLEEALAWHQQAVAAAPRDPTTHAALAVTLRRRLDPLGSITACRRALELAPDRTDLWLLLGANLASAGDFDAAHACCRKVLELDPDSSEARRDLAMIGQQSDDATEIIRLRTMLDSPATPERERIAAGFALGTLLDRRADHDAAFAGFEAANRLMHAALAAQGKAYDAAGLHNYVDWAISTFRKDTIHATDGWGDPSELPVFIVGMPRSGTSLIEQICASHGKVFGAGERRAIGEVVRALHGGATHLPPSRWNPDAVRQAAAAQVAALQALGGDAACVIDKMPDNSLILGYIAVLFPNARVIICRRDIRDTCLSCYFQQFGEGNAWAFDQAELASRAREVDRLMHHWRTVLPLHMIDVRYEDVVADQEAETRRLLQFLGLEWDPACLAFHQTERPVMTASVWQVRQAMYAGSIGRWRNYRRHLAPLLVGLAPLLPADAQQDWDALAADPASAIALAAPHHRDGRLDCAEPVYHALLRRDPDDPAALHLLGLLLVDRGNPRQAAALIARSLELRPDVPAALADLARACRAAGDAAAALRAARRAADLDPDLPDAQVQLGCALSAQQCFAEAIPVLRRALERAPASLEPRIFLASALFRVRDFAASAEQWQTVIDQKPDDPDFLIEYAAAAGEMHQIDAALTSYRKALALAPGHAKALHGIGWALLQSGDAPGAVAACQQAMTANDADPDVWLTLANALAAIGRFDAAAAAFQRTLALDPTSGEALTGQAKVGRGLDHAADRDAVRAVLLDTGKPDRERVSAGFAIGAACDRLGLYDEAFDAYATANRLLRAHRAAHGFAFGRHDLSKLVNWLVRNIGPATFAQTAGLGDPSATPVFIVGLPRSGTTLVEQIAASHPLVFGAGERRDIPGILAALDGQQTARQPATWDRAALRREAAAQVARLDALALGSLGHPAVRVIDKLPDNIMWLGQIAVLFPNARIIVCRRDLRDVCLSCFFQYFRDDAMMWTDDLADCAFRAREIERLTQHWLKVLPVAVTEVRYETLVANLECEARRLIDFLGLAWDPACLSFHTTERTVLTASHWQVRQPVYATSVGRWRRYEKHLGPMLRELDPTGIIPEPLP